MFGGNMKGLRHFIAGIRKTIAYEDEVKIVEEEKTKIRTNFASTNSSSYDRRKYCLKLMYMHILGHSVDFGLLQASQLMTSKVKEEKLVGYVVLGELLQDQPEFLRLVTQSVMYDLQNVNEFATPLALTFVANCSNSEMAEVVAPQVIQLVSAQKGQVNTYIRKKAALALLHLYRINPNSVDTDNINEMLIQLMEAKNVGFLNCLTHLLFGISESSPHIFETLKTRAIYLLSKILIKREVSADHQYYGCPCPWLCISLMRFLRRLTPTLAEAVDPQHGKIDQRALLEKIIMETFKHTSAIPSTVQSNILHINWAIAVEAGYLANFYSDYFEDTINVNFMVAVIVDKKIRPNLRFSALNALSSMSRMVSVSIAIRLDLRAIVEVINSEMDFSLRGKGQALLFNSADSETAEGVAQCILSGARATRFPIDYREESLLRAAILCERYGLYSTVNVDGLDTVRESFWTLKTMISLLPTAAELKLRYVWMNLANAIMMKIYDVDDEGVRGDVIYELLANCLDREQLAAGTVVVLEEPMILTVACYVVTECIFESFGRGEEGVFSFIKNSTKFMEHQDVFSSEAVFAIVSQAIILLQTQNFREELPVAVSAMIALCYMGICPMENLQMLTVSPVADVQQRALEGIAIMQIQDRDVVVQLLQQTPILTHVRGLESVFDRKKGKKAAADADAGEEEAEEDAVPSQDVEDAAKDLEDALGSVPPANPSEGPDASDRGASVSAPPPAAAADATPPATGSVAGTPAPAPAPAAAPAAPAAPAPQQNNVSLDDLLGF